MFPGQSSIPRPLASSKPTFQSKLSKVYLSPFLNDREGGPTKHTSAAASDSDDPPRGPDPASIPLPPTPSPTPSVKAKSATGPTAASTPASRTPTHQHQHQHQHQHPGLSGLPDHAAALALLTATATADLTQIKTVICTITAVAAVAFYHDHWVFGLLTLLALVLSVVGKLDWVVDGVRQVGETARMVADETKNNANANANANVNANAHALKVKNAKLEDKTASDTAEHTPSTNASPDGIDYANFRAVYVRDDYAAPSFLAGAYDTPRRMYHRFTAGWTPPRR